MNVQIKNIEELLPLDGNKKIIHHKVSQLTAPGENYGSLMLAVDITVATPEGNEEIHAVAKTVPPNKVIQEIFNTSVTFRNEIGFYKYIVLVLRRFQKEHHVQKVIDFFPNYLGSRLNLTGGDEVDQDAALVLENLKLSNYVTLDRLQGFDLDIAKLIVTDLAHLHAVPLGLKIEKPDIFEEQIKPYLKPWLPKEKNHEIFKRQLMRIIDQVEELGPLRERIIASFDTQMVLNEPREPFATISHSDCWVNNNMIKLEGNKAVKSKLVDFQVCSYGSPARDLVFFLFTSVKNHVVERHYDELLKLYHDTLIALLKELKCDTAAFSFEALQEEMDFEAGTSQFGHVVFMLSPVFAAKGQVREIAEFDIEDLVKEDVSDLHKEKLVFVVKEFVKRNWI